MNEILEKIYDLVGDARDCVDEAMAYVDEIEDIFRRNDIDKPLDNMRKDMKEALNKSAKVCDILNALDLTLDEFRRKNL